MVNNMKKEENKEIHVKIENPTVSSAENYVKMVGMGDLIGMTLIGPAGMGKTHLVQNVLDEMSVAHIKYGGHITLASIYEYLCENNDKLIFFDDCSQLITHTEIMELLKQALQVSARDRVLHYRSHGAKINAPKSFVFDGRIVMAFNALDKTNPNVRAIIDRAPAVELKYSRNEIYDAMYKIASGDGGGLLEYEKMIVTKEIEDYTKQDINMHVSLRSQQLAFKIFASFKKMFGETNEDWKPEVKKLFGKVKESWIRELLKDIVADGRISRKEFAKQIALKKDMSPRNAYRRIAEFLEIGEIFSNKINGGDVSITPFK